MIMTRVPRVRTGRPIQLALAGGVRTSAPAARRPKLKGRQVIMVEPGRLARAKFAYTTRRVPVDAIGTILPSERQIRAGDVVLARVTRLGQHEHIELPNGRRATLYEGDEVVVSFGNRYAPDQFEAVVPDRLGPCQLVAAGGIAATVIHKHSRMREATEILPEGLIGDARGQRINLLGWGLTPMKPDPVAPRPPVIVVVGTSMNSGKTTVISCLTRGLNALGYRVGAAKVTGTGAGGDHWHMADAGADPAMDFIDAGYASTYRLSSRDLDQAVWTQLAHLFRSGVDYVLAEISDGLLEQETARLLTSMDFGPFFDAIIFTAAESLGAVAGIAWLRERGLPVIAISGVLTGSPLSMREALGAAEIPIYPSQSFIRPEMASQILKCAAARAAGTRRPGPAGKRTPGQPHRP
jgi:hypothetical protein